MESTCENLNRLNSVLVLAKFYSAGVWAHLLIRLLLLFYSDQSNGCSTLNLSQLSLGPPSYCNAFDAQKWSLMKHITNCV